MSDPVSDTVIPSLEARMDDVRAVIDAAGADEAALMGVSEGAPLCALFAATYSQRTRALVPTWLCTSATPRVGGSPIKVGTSMRDWRALSGGSPTHGGRGYEPSWLLGALAWNRFEGTTPVG
jgi:pimeloyl-ACP methyl ester carboxylesterase